MSQTISPPELNEDDHWLPLPLRRQAADQAVALLPKARAGGLRFEAYVTKDLAAHILERIAKGDFIDPGEALMVMLQDYMDFLKYPDLRREAFKRNLEDASEGPFLTHEEVMQTVFSEPLPEPAQWVKHKTTD